MSRIRELNDAFRTSFVGGRVMITQAIQALDPLVLERIIMQVRSFDEFSEDSDPHSEHDFGAFDVAGERVFWKIDAYDKNLEYGSPDPSDPAVTTRVLTIMLASEY